MSERDSSEETTPGGGGEGVDFDALAQAASAARQACPPAWIAIDTETSGVSYGDEAFCVTAAWPDGEAEYTGHYLELSHPASRKVAEDLLEHTPIWVFHNAKFDLQKLLLAGVISREDVARAEIHDTEALAHLLDENRSKKLKDLAVDLLGWDDTISVELKTKPGQFREVSREKYELDEARRKLKLKIEDGYEVLPREVVIPYAIRDAEFTARLYDLLSAGMAAQDEGLQALYQREMELTIVLLDVESAGVKVDVPYLEETNRRLVRECFRIEADILQLTGRDEFVNHHEWIKSAFADLGEDVPADTQADTLAGLDSPLAALITEWRTVSKLQSTYIQPMLAEQIGGILHPNFRQHGTRTGRMSSGGATG